jgi:hypothetical protein
MAEGSMDISESIKGLIFIIVAVAQVVVSFIVFSYAAYSFLETLVGTASGDDEVIWPGDPLPDWIWKLWYMLWIVGIWAVPVYFLLGLFHRLTPAQFAVVLSALLWLIFPMSLLSSLSGPSRWLILRRSVVRSLLKYSGTLALFYAVTGVIFVVAGGAGYLALFGELIYWVPVAAACSAIAFLLYARLLGRMALLISLNPAGVSGGDHPDQPEEAADGLPSQPEVDASEAAQPAAVEPQAVPVTVPTQLDGPSKEPEPLLPVEMPASTSAAPAEALRSETDAETYSLAPPEATAPPSVPDYAPVQRPAKEEFKLAVSYDVPPPPKWPLWEGVYSFPFYKTSLSALFFLMFGFFAVIGLFRALVALFPFREQP